MSKRNEKMSSWLSSVDVNDEQLLQQWLQRRCFLSRSTMGLGSAALASLLGREAQAEVKSSPYLPKAKRVIYLFQSGGPSQLDLFDPKPNLADRFGEEVPKSVYPDDRKTTMTSAQSSFATCPSRFRFVPSGESGTQISEVLPYTAQIEKQ